VVSVLTTDESPAAVLRHAADRSTSEESTVGARVLDPADPADRAALLDLAAEPHVRVVDTVVAQLDELVRSRAPERPLDGQAVRAQVAALLADTPPELFGCWVYQPWVGRLVHVLPASLHRELRLDRNRYKITEAEQERLFGLTIAVAGLSVGRSVAGTLVREGIGGELRLADFDALDVSNLNRVPGGVADIGVNKAVLAAREIVELDPYVRVVTHTDGVRPDTVDDFLAGVDVVLDECDDLEVKLLLRERARAAGVPVVMVTSERGLLDVERFDTEPGRAPFHGLLAGVRACDLRGLTTREKVPFVLRIVDTARLGARAAASLVEVRSSLSTWPQLASDVVLGGAMAANAVRRIALGELTASGRYAVDLDALVQDGRAEPIPQPTPSPQALTPDLPTLPAPGAGGMPSATELRFVTACATLAPSGGNAQPWRFTAADGCLAADLDPARTGTMLDFRGRGSVLALGAAREAAVIGATAAGFTADPLDGALWRLRLRRTHPAGNTADLALLRQRHCRRNPRASGPIPKAAHEAIDGAAGGLAVRWVTHPAGLAALGTAMGELGRLQVLSPGLHRQLVAELRWSDAEARTTRDGIDLAALGMDVADLAALRVLRSPATVERLRTLGLGGALRTATRNAFATAGAALVVGTPSTAVAALLDAGGDLLRLWLAATGHGIGVHPFGTPFLAQRLAEEPESLAPWERDAVRAALPAITVPDATVLLVLRLSTDDASGGRSLRRPVEEVLTFLG
jgi:hypothetical protein